MRKKVEQFLAAPDSLRHSEIEQRKAVLRKEKDEAEKHRLRVSKSSRRPTIEDLLADMIRVAEDQETNPFWRFKSISPRRYELFGYFPIEFIFEQFGQFEHAKQVAGLVDQPGTRSKKAARAERSRREHSSRYAERHILPHCNKHPDLEREASGSRLVLSISDTHSTFLDPFTWYVFLCCCRDLKPDVVVFNGDILEGSEISRYPKIPGWTIPLQLEFDFAREMFRQSRKALGPDPRMVWTAGNHCVDRLASYLTQVAPALANLRTLRFDALAGVQEHDVVLAQGGTIVSPMGTEGEKPGILLFGSYRVHHGTFTGPDCARKELLDAGRSGQSGHVHRAMLYTDASEARRGLSWMVTPAGCTDRASRAYVKRLCAGWTTGFGVAVIHPGGWVNQYPVSTIGDTASVEGYVFQRPKDLPEQDPQKLWITDFPVP